MSRDLHPTCLTTPAEDGRRSAKLTCLPISAEIVRLLAPIKTGKFEKCRQLGRASHLHNCRIMTVPTATEVLRKVSLGPSEICPIQSKSTLCLEGAMCEGYEETSYFL